MKKQNKKPQNKNGKNSQRKPESTTQFLHEILECCAIYEKANQKLLANRRKTKTRLKQSVKAKRQYFSKPAEIKNALNHIRANKSVRGIK